MKAKRKKIEDNKTYKTRIRRVLKKTWESKVRDVQIITSIYIYKHRISEEDRFLWRSSD
jgi:hypothetical protein